MKLLDIVNQLKIVLPQYTDKFSTNINVTSIDATNNTITIITDEPHNLTTGEDITLSNYLNKTPIESITQNGFVYTITTKIDHDLTEGFQERVSIDGFDASVWNCSFDLLAVPNRRTFKISSSNNIPILNGNEYLLENRIDGINGQHTVNVLDDVTLTISGNFLNGSYSNGTINSNVRIVGAVSFDRFIEEYTEHNINELYIAVVMDDVSVSKDRNTYSDAVSSPSTGSELRLLMIDGFMIYIVGNVSQDIAAQDMVDLTRHTLFLPILKSVYGIKFNTGLTNDTDFRTIFIGNGVALYNKAIYAHVFEFQQSAYIVEDDAVDPINSRAFRDSNFSETIGDQDMSVVIDLDDEPLDRS